MPFRAEVLHSQVDYSRVDAGMRQMVQQFRARRIYAEALGHTHHGFHGAHGAHGNAHHGFHGARGYNGMHNNNVRVGNRNSVDLGAVLEGRDVRTTACPF